MASVRGIMSLSDGQMWDGGSEASQRHQRSFSVPFFLERRLSIPCFHYFTHVLTHENLGSASTIFLETVLYIFSLCLKH